VTCVYVAMDCEGLARFSGSLLKKYQVDIAGLLQYIANQLKAQKR